MLAPTQDSLMSCFQRLGLEEDGGLAKQLVAHRLFSEVVEPPRMGRFTDLRLLGTGGMSRVYAARDPLHGGRDVALKVMRPAVSGGQARLVREARLAARLRHPNLVEVYELGVDPRGVFVVMELIEGPTFAAWLRAGTRDRAEILELLIGAGEALEAAHAEGVVHGDFKPCNLLIEQGERGRGRARVVDFGLARAYALTGTGRVSGTRGYVAPELLAGAEPGPRADIFAFCVTALEALVLSDGVHGALPRPVLRALLRGIETEPSARWASMAELLAELRAHLGHGPVRRWLAKTCGRG